MATKILVQKFGGTSVATPESREMVYRKIEAAKVKGYGVVAVISAMGRKGAPYATDTLLDLVRLDCPGTAAREMDLIFVCGEIISGVVVTANLQRRGHAATYLTGGQAGIVTSADHGDARILEIRTARVRGLLEKGHIVVVAGGQGATAEGEVTTLGRGGSDTTGTALGVALEAEAIEIYTDVTGGMTADPRVVPEAALLREITYGDCCQMAYQGAKVMHPRAVEIASQKPNIPLWVRSTFSDDPGTLICSPTRHLAGGADRPGRGGAVGVAVLGGQTVLKVEEKPATDVAADVSGAGGGHLGKSDILRRLEEAGVPAADIHPEPGALLLVTEDRAADAAEAVLKGAGLSAARTTGASKVSLVGEDLTSSPRLTAEVLAVLAKAGLEVLAMVSRPDVIAVWVDGAKAGEAARAMHALVEKPAATGVMGAATPTKPKPGQQQVG